MPHAARRAGAAGGGAYTATADPGLDGQAAAAGAHAVVEKSANIDDLFDTLRLAVRGGGQAA